MISAFSTDSRWHVFHNATFHLRGESITPRRVMTSAETPEKACVLKESAPGSQLSYHAHLRPPDHAYVKSQGEFSLAIA